MKKEKTAFYIQQDRDKKRSIISFRNLLQREDKKQKDNFKTFNKHGYTTFI